MSDLISKSELIEIIKGTDELLDFQKDECIICINACDIAYDIDKVVAELEKIRAKETCNKEKCDTKEICRICVVDDAIEIVKQGGISDDVCEEVCCEWKHFSGDKSPYRPSCKEYMKSKFEAFKIGDYCTFCGKKIKIVGD